MESFLGFEGETIINQQQKSYYSHKLVPWLSWDEWVFVKNSLFSKSPDSVASALQRISTWRSRGCLPVVIDVTATIIEIQQKDPYYRGDKTNDASLSENLLALLYCGAIIRLVNGLVDKTRKKEEISLAVAADAIDIPRMLIDVRHEGTHGDLPALQVARSASIRALDWLKYYYWKPQSMAIPFQGDGNANIRKEVKSKLRELALCLKVKQNPHSKCSELKGKRARQGDLLCGRNKSLVLLAGNPQTLRSGGTKKQINKILKTLVQLYSSFSLEIVSVLLDFLLKALSSSESVEHADIATVGPTIDSILADWKLVVLKLSNKEPDLFLTLLKRILDVIETWEAMKYEKGSQNITLSDSRAEICQIEHLSCLFAWLVRNLNMLELIGWNNSATEAKVPSAETKISTEVLLELIRKCLMLSAPGNRQLMKSAIHLAQLMGDRSVMDKLTKLSLLGLSNVDFTEEENASILTSEDIFQQEESIRRAAKNLELVKQLRTKRKNVVDKDSDLEESNKWVLAKSWNPCPIGMLPRAVGLSGHLPVLDWADYQKKDTELLEENENSKDSQSSVKREATSDPQRPDNSTGKKIKVTVECHEPNEDLFPIEGDKGCLMIGGVSRRVREEDLLAIKADVRILV
ncbi:LAS1-like protein [Quillaja saponaria]|uniref:LAS1-like protein n=1 Tax=Quillaja saponaria TaxID=32244 RepID=A0AAD7PMT1_QUISA|nr:LAS1-like protein [Quillaja saponaria]